MDNIVICNTVSDWLDCDSDCMGVWDWLAPSSSKPLVSCADARFKIDKDRLMLDFRVTRSNLYIARIVVITNLYRQDFKTKYRYSEERHFKF